MTVSRASGDGAGAGPVEVVMVGTGGSGPINAVREGMRVVDSTGEDIGTVAQVRMGDSGAVTAEGRGLEGDGLLSAAAEAISGHSGLPEQEQDRLDRLGYIRIDVRGLFKGDRYAASDEIAGVTGESVELTVPADRLVG